MAQDIRIPDIGDAEDVEVVEILVAAGDRVGEDDPIIVIESDKASMEVPAGTAGEIASVEVAVGDKVAEGQVIARLAQAAGGSDDEEGGGDAEEVGSKAEEGGSEAEEGGSEGEEAEEAGSDDAEDAQSGEGEDGDAGATENVDVKVPDIGDADNVEVIEVLVQTGDTVAADDLLVVVESDKASMEIPSSHSGKVVEVHVQVGSQVEEGTRLVTLESASGAGSVGQDKGAPAQRKDDRAAAAGQAGEESRRGPDGAEEDKAEAAGEGAAPPAGDAAAGAGEGEVSAGKGARVYAGPAVRRLARELGVDLEAVEGTGGRGRIVKDDVKEHVKRRLKAPSAGAGSGGVIAPMPAVDFSKFGEIEEQPLSRIRARGAENLHRAWLNIPHVTQHDEVDVTDLETFRRSLKAEGERRGVKVTPVAFIIKACCQVLKEFPTFNASLDPAARNFILKRYYHIGMAVDTPDGLVVPVIRDADRKGIWELSAEVAELADKAREKKLAPRDMQGGSFSVSSLGAIGGTGFTPIINAPEVAILGVSRVTTRPVWQDGGFVPRQMLPLSLSYDHRAINGAEAGRFVTRLGELLTDLRRLVL